MDADRNAALSREWEAALGADQTPFQQMMRRHGLYAPWSGIGDGWVPIVDRLITSGPNTTVYAYTPGSGIAVYKTNNGAQPVLGTTTPVAFVSGDTTSYTPVAGTRYEWTQQALLERAFDDCIQPMDRNRTRCV